MSGESLSQEEIDALLAGAAGGEPAAEAPPEPEPEAAPEPVAEAVEADAEVVVADAEPVAEDVAADTPPPPTSQVLVDRFADLLTDEERDTIGEVGNICMASAATTLSTLLGNQVVITTPTVTVTTESDVVDLYHRPAALVRIRYTEGLNGSNVFVISTRDASIVADLMMGGPGNPSDEIDEIHASAVGEAMNQMMGAAATSMANMFGRRVDISSPEVQVLDLADDDASIGLVNTDDPMVCAGFDLQVGDLLATTLMQLMPLEFAKDLVAALMPPAAPAEPEPAPVAAPVAEPVMAQAVAEPVMAAAATAATMAPAPPQMAPQEPAPVYMMSPGPSPIIERPGAVAQPAAFPALGDGPPSNVPGDIGLIMDVPLQISVELGRTELRIRNVLELVPGSIIELDRLAGEPVDVLVNGKQLARGEVVVIDEEFGIRITEIASQASRLRGIADG